MLYYFLKKYDKSKFLKNCFISNVNENKNIKRNLKIQ